MTSIFAVAFGLLVLLMMWQRQRPAFVLGLIIIYSLAYRMVDIAYLDLAGPTYAIELDRHVGGNGAAPMFVFASLCYILPLWYFSSTNRLLKKIDGPLEPNIYHVYLSRATLAACGAYLAFLYGDMLRIGTIPLLTGMDRIQYNDIAGILHRRAYEMNFLFCTILGVFTVLPRLRGERYNLAFAMLALATLAYWALTGNRFSAFLITGTYYALPFSAALAMERKGLIARQTPSDAWGYLVSSRVLAPLGSILVIVAIIGLVMNSYYSVRNYADPTFQITQRVLVQPVQTWASTWTEVSLNPDRGFNDRAIEYVLINPPNREGNTTVQYLMEKELGYFRANELINLGQQYAGGYPEIFFELFGVTWAIAFMILFGIAAAFIASMAVRNLLRGNPLSAIMSVYVYFALTLAYIGGMLNSLTTPTLALKIVALIAVTIFENVIGGRAVLHRASALHARRTAPGLVR